MGSAPLHVQAAVEGIVDEAVVRRLFAEVGIASFSVFPANGKRRLQQRLDGYNRAAEQSPWVVLVDLNHSAACAAELCRHWLPRPAPRMYLRVAVRSVEAWLLADREAIGRMLGVSVARIPPNPDSLAAPKQTLVDLARRARQRTVREDMVPRPGSGRSEGSAYASRIIEFADRSWRPAIAQNASNSLCRCLTALRKMYEEPMIDS